MIFRSSALRAACYYYYCYNSQSAAATWCSPTVALQSSSSFLANSLVRRNIHWNQSPFALSIRRPMSGSAEPPAARKENPSVMEGNDHDDDYAYVASNFRSVQERVNAAAAATANKQPVRLVAVSKTKPLSAMKVAYDAGCRVFGENYVQEMIGKMEQWKKEDDNEHNEDNAKKPSSQVQWHFIGSLQSNKCNALVKAIVTYSDLRRCTIETVSSIKVADKLNHAVQQQQMSVSPPAPPAEHHRRLKVFVQVNTSGEDTKSGVTEIEPVIDLCRHVVRACPYLELRGLMTIGAAGNERDDFIALVQCRDHVTVALAKNDPSIAPYLELSMGMSGDYLVAIPAGSSNVRVGSTIFGERDYSQK